MKKGKIRKEIIAAMLVILAGVAIAVLSSYASVTGQVTVSDACGSGRVIPPETCDEGVDENTDIPCTPAYDSSCTYCDTSCQSQNVQGPFCGDNNVDQPFEQCETSNDCQVDEECISCTCVTTTTTTSSTTTTTTTTVPVCGNEILEEGEQCDDGNQFTNDACVNCQNAFCGDTFVWNTDGGTEECETDSDCIINTVDEGPCDTQTCQCIGTTTTTTSTTTTTTLAPQSCNDECIAFGPSFIGGNCRSSSSQCQDFDEIDVGIGQNSCAQDEICCCVFGEEL